MSDFKQKAEQYQRRLRELEEQMQNDNRIEQLEGSLRNTQERSDELEFQLTKLKQVCPSSLGVMENQESCSIQTHATLKTERDELEARQLEHSKNQSELQVKHSELQKLHATAQQALTAYASEKGGLTREKSDLRNQFDSTQRTLTEVQEKLAQAVIVIASNTRQLQAAKDDLKSATHRAEDAEKIQQDLQAENTSLLRSLDEMRPKIVELTGAKLELMERNSSLELELRQSNETATQLETTLHEVARTNEDLEIRTRDLLVEREKERARTVADSSELQKAYDELQEELDSVLASLRNLEAERSGHHQDMTCRLEEIESLTSSSRTKSEESSALRRELDAVNDAQVSYSCGSLSLRYSLYLLSRRRKDKSSLHALKMRSRLCEPI